METKPHVCPVWMGYLMNTPLRKLQQDPFKILGNYIHPGMNVLEIGPALGFFSIPIAAMVAPDGKLYSVDIQKRMLEKLEVRARQKNLNKHLITILASQESQHIEHLYNQIDFCLLAFVVHEIPDQEKFFKEIAHTMKKGSRALFIEPAWHVKVENWEKSILKAEMAGFLINRDVRVGKSRACELIKS